MLITPALANTVTPVAKHVTPVANKVAATANHVAQKSSLYSVIMNLLPFILIFAVFYFILILPQRKKQKAHKEMMNNLKVGNKVVLTSGITGKIVKVKDNSLIIQTADTTEVEVYRSFVAQIINE